MSIELLGNICEIVGGNAAPKGDDAFGEKGLPFVKMKDLGRQHLSINLIEIENKVSETVAKRNGLKIVKKGAILIPRSGSVGLNHRAILGVDSYIVSHICALIVKDKGAVLNLFLYYYLRTINFESITKKTTGLDAITFQDLAKVKVPIPSLEDQLRITKVLSKAESLISQRKESLRLLDELLKSTFLEMFGDPVMNKKRWMKSPIIEFADCIVPGRDKPKSFTGDVPWITTDDLVDMGFTKSSRKTVGLSPNEISEVRARVIPTNSILVTCVGDLGILSINTKPIVVNQQLHTFQCRSGLNNIFAMYSLMFQKNFMYKTASTTTVPYMNKTICNSIPVIIPPIILQTKFARIVEKAEALKAHYQASLQELENLYGTLSQRAFKGEIKHQSRSNRISDH